MSKQKDAKQATKVLSNSELNILNLEGVEDVDDLENLLLDIDWGFDFDDDWDDLEQDGIFYVVNDNVNGGCKIDASVFTEAAVSPTFSGDKQAQYGEKNSEITDAYQTYELSLDKVVEGNMGDKNRKFDFTINFSDPANTSFTFGNELITLDSNGSGSVNLQLSHEDAAAEITGIPSTVTYTVTENLNSSEGYDTDFAVSKGTGISQAVAKDEAASDAAKVTAQQQTMTKADNAVTVTNRRVAASPTGVMLSITPYALVAGLASLLGALFFRRKKLS